jgi:hypothetical protein
MCHFIYKDKRKAYDLSCEWCRLLKISSVVLKVKVYITRMRLFQNWPLPSQCLSANGPGHPYLSFLLQEYLKTAQPCFPFHSFHLHLMYNSTNFLPTPLSRSLAVLCLLKSKAGGGSTMSFLRPEGVTCLFKISHFVNQ